MYERNEKEEMEIWENTKKLTLEFLYYKLNICLCEH